MARRFPRFFLADLVALVAIVGLILGLFQASGPTGFIGVVILIMVVLFAWQIFRASRDAPTCDECGGRFVLHEKKNSPPPVCPQCGQPQLGYARMRKRLAISFWAVLALMVLSGALTFGYVLKGSSLLSSSSSIVNFGNLLLMMMISYVVLMAILIARSMHGFARYKTVPCDQCGAIIPRGGATGPLICPRCRVRKLAGKKAKDQVAKGVLILLALLALIATVPGLMFGDSVGSRLGLGRVIAVPLTIVVTMIAVPSTLVVIWAFF